MNVNALYYLGYSSQERKEKRSIEGHAEEIHNNVISIEELEVPFRVVKVTMLSMLARG